MTGESKTASEAQGEAIRLHMEERARLHHRWADGGASLEQRAAHRVVALLLEEVGIYVRTMEEARRRWEAGRESCREARTKEEGFVG